jgi:hypothetical protein
MDFLLKHYTEVSVHKIMMQLFSQVKEGEREKRARKSLHRSSFYSPFYSKDLSSFHG